MNKDNYEKIMSYLDVIDLELDKISFEVDHPSFKEYTQGLRKFKLLTQARYKTEKMEKLLNLVDEKLTKEEH